jgi:hypothetical protein
MYNIHFTIVPYINSRILRYNKRFELLFTLKRNKRVITMFYILKYIKCTLRIKNRFKIKFPLRLRYSYPAGARFLEFFFKKFLNPKIIIKSKFEINNIYIINFKEKCLVEKFFNFYYDIKDFLFFRKNFLSKIFFCYNKLQELIKTNYKLDLKNKSLRLFLNTKMVRFSYIEYSKFLQKHYEIKARHLRAYTRDETIHRFTKVYKLNLKGRKTEF